LHDRDQPLLGDPGLYDDSIKLAAGGEKNEKLQPPYFTTPPRLRAESRMDGSLSEKEFSDLRDGLLDPRALPENLVDLIPASLPSGPSLHIFESTPPTPWLAPTVL
jgi:hypothetical protein